MTAFRDAVAATDPAADPSVRQEVLRAIAALQPFRVGQAGFRTALSELAGKPFDQLMPHIRRLEEAAVLLRRGDSLRIVPDLLGDVLLADAAADLPSGTPTGYLERVLEYAEGDCLLRVLANASRVDWQIRTGDPASPSLAEPMWPIIASRFRDGDVPARLRLLEVVRAVAFFQPAAAIELVRWAMTHLASAEDPADQGRHEQSGRRVLEALPGVLENAAYDREYLRQAADMLWELAGRDQRSPGQHPGHPIRILRSLVEYNLAKPTEFHDLMIDAAAEWLRALHADWLYSPFEVLSPLLATAVTNLLGDGRTFTFRTYAVSAAAVRNLRRRVLDLAFAEAQSQDLRSAVEAMNAIGVSIRYENPADHDEQQQWTAQFIETIERIGDLLAGTDLDPVVSIAARHALWWHAEHSPTSTRPAAEKALSRLPGSASHHLALALHDGWGHLVARGKDVAESELLREAALSGVVAETAARWPDDERLIDQIEERIAVDRRAFRRSGSPRPFIWTLTQARPSTARVICQRVARDPASVLQDALPAALSRLADALPGEAIRQALDLLATDDVTVMRCVAEAFGFARGNRAALLDGEDDLLRSLLNSEDPEVRSLAVTAAIALARTSPGLAMNLLAEVNVADSPTVAEAIAAAFGPYSGLSWADLPQSQANQILDQLRKCPSLNSYEITALLAEIVKRQPDSVLDLLKDRVETWEHNKTLRSSYLPVPRAWHVKPDFKAHERYPALLRGVLDWIADGRESTARRVMGAEIFAAVAAGFDEQATAIVMEALQSDDTARVRAASAICREAPAELIWEQNFVRQALHAAARHGIEHAETVARSLLAAAINGTPAVTIGQEAGDQAAQNEALTKIVSETPQGSIEERFYQSLARWHQNLMRLDEDISDQRTDRREW